MTGLSSGEAARFGRPLVVDSPASESSTPGASLGLLLAQALARWDQLLQDGFRRRGYPEVLPSFRSVLWPLFEQDGLRMREIARRTQLPKQTMTGLVRACEHAGLVVREADPDDRRQWRLSLTAKGQAFREVAVDALGEMEARLTATMSGESSNELRAGLAAIISIPEHRGDARHRPDRDSQAAMQESVE